MILKPDVKVKPWWFNIIPWLNKYTANAIYPNVYVPQNMYENLLSQKPNPKHIGVLIHEETHLERERKMGPIKFGAKYFLSPKFRFNEELAANREMYKFLKKHKVKHDIEKHSRFLSGWLYLWPVSYEYAKKELEKAWEEA